MLGGYRIFFREFRRTYHTTGAISPSGRRLGDALAHYVRERRDRQRAQNNRPIDQPAAGRRILEVGPGTGAVTRQIIAALAPDDRLELVELNDRFVAHLRQRLVVDPAFCRASDRVRVIHSPVEQLPDAEAFDLLISGLPLNNFSVGTVQGLLDTFRRLLAPGGTLSFFEYVGIRRMKAAISGRQVRERLTGIGELLGGCFSRYEIRRDCVWQNLPPAWVHHLRFDRELQADNHIVAGGRML